MKPTPRVISGHPSGVHPNTRHGHASGGRLTPEYKAWQSMRDRCRQDSHDRAFYADRGVIVDPQWMDFMTFLSAVGPRPSPAHSLDRYPNRDGNYEPGNVRWATRTQQANNLRSNRVLTVGGETSTVAEWARRTGLKKSTIGMRLARGDSDVEALRPLP